MENSDCYAMGGTGLWVPVAEPEVGDGEPDHGIERYKRLAAAMSSVAALNHELHASIGHAVDADVSARGLVAASRRAERIARRMLRDIEAANR